MEQEDETFQAEEQEFIDGLDEGSDIEELQEDLDEQASIDPEVEAKARDMGWVPKEEYQGNPDHWRGADEFVKRGEEILPIVKSRAERSEHRVKELQQQLDQRDQDWSNRMARMEAMNKRAVQKALEARTADFERQRRAAVELGDTDAYDRLNEEEHALWNEEFEAEQNLTQQFHQPRQPAQEPLPPEIQDWVVKNPWFQNDLKLSTYAQYVHGELLQKEPGLTMAQNLEKTRQEVRNRFPEDFGIEKRPRQSAGYSPVEGGSPTASGLRTNNGKSWNELPPEAKRAGADFIDEGLYKTKDDYAKAYWSQ